MELASARHAAIGCNRPVSLRRLSFVAPAPRPRTARNVARHVRQRGDYDEDDDDIETFYTVLGVDQFAEQAEIKRAYYALMKSIHPDLSDPADVEETTEYAVFLNDIYETLSDPETRAAYDQIAGLSARAVNPFTDRSQRYAKDQVFVDEYACIGCHACANVAPATFFMEPEYGRARARCQNADSGDTVQEAIDACPADCIHWVTAPQLSLLENTMRRMERKDVWLLRQGEGAALNVFFEARLAWARRVSQARVRALAGRRGLEASGGSWKEWVTMGPAAGSMGAGGGYEGESEGDDTPASAESRRRAASSVAAASRRWRTVQRAQTRRRKGDAGLLPGSTEQ